MSKIKLANLLKNKKQGDTWQSILAPEQYKFWTFKNKWCPKVFNKFGINIAAIRIAACESEKPASIRFRRKEPLYLECGVNIHKGYVTTSAKREAGFTIRVDSIIELNTVLSELSEKYGLKQWEIRLIEIYNPDEAAYIEFTIHNPDGNGPNLSLYRVRQGKNEIMYPELSYFEQQKYCKKFQYSFAHCVADKQIIMTHACGLKKQKKANVVTKKKNK